MDKHQKTSGMRFWMWIALAFFLGTVVGFVAALSAILVLNARIDYV